MKTARVKPSAKNQELAALPASVEAPAVKPESPPENVEAKPLDREQTVSTRRDQSGRQSDERFRLASNVLLWEQDGLTLRIEGAISKEQALRIAALGGWFVLCFIAHLVSKLFGRSPWPRRSS